MTLNLKPRKCRRCKAAYKPNTEWQKFCSPQCKASAANQKKLDLIKRAQRIINAQAVGQ